LDRLEKLGDDASKAFDKYLTEQQKALDLFSADKLAQQRKTTFEKYTVTSYPRYISAKKAWKSAEALVANFRRQVIHTDETLNDRINKINELALNEDSRQNGSVPLSYINQTALTNFTRYNMPVYARSDFITNLTRPWVQREITDPADLVYQPFFATSGLEEAADNWYAGSSPNTQVSLSLKNSGSHDWSALGHTTSVIQGSAGLFGFIGASAASSSSHTQFNSYSTSFSDDVAISFSFRGAPATFNLRAGFW
jgi:hypothetical protein